MKLIVEQNFQDILVEKHEEGKDLYITGIYLQSEQVNRNKRFYPKPILEKEANRYIKERVNTKRGFGELEHPQSPVVNPDRMSHIVTEMKQNGNDYVGKAIVTNTPKGNIVRGIVEAGGVVGVSSRGLGTLKQRSDGINEVTEDYNLRCIDVVLDPSAPDAFVNGIMEGVDWICEGGVFKPVQIEEAKKELDNSGTNVKKNSMLIYRKFLNCFNQ